MTRSWLAIGGKRDQVELSIRKVAEIGAAFFCAQWGITDTAKRLDHADYVADWLLAMKTDSRAILTAASKAQQAMDYLNTAAGINTDHQPDKRPADISGAQVAA